MTGSVPFSDAALQRMLVPTVETHTHTIVAELTILHQAQIIRLLLQNTLQILQVGSQFLRLLRIKLIRIRRALSFKSC